MRELNQKAIKTLIELGIAKDITNEPSELYRNVDVLALSFGKYGKNGGLLRDRDTQELLAVPSRASTLFKYA